MAEETNELNQEPTEIQALVNVVAHRGITIDFEGWFMKGTDTYVWKLKRLSAADTKQLRDLKKKYEMQIQKVKLGQALDSSLEDMSDLLAKSYFQIGLEDFTEDDWTAIWNDPKLGRGSINQCATELFIFLMEVTTKQEAQRLLKQPPEGTPAISDINRDYRKSGKSTTP